MPLKWRLGLSDNHIVAGGNNPADIPDIPASVVRHLATLFTHAEGNAERRQRSDRTVAGECSIIYEDLVELYGSQEKRCWYSHLEMGFEEGDPWVCSLDPKRGYIKENIKLVVGELNGRQQWTTEGISSLYKLI